MWCKYACLNVVMLQAFQQPTPQQQPSNAYNSFQQGYPAGPPQQNAAAPAYGESSQDYRQQSGYYRQQSDPMSEYGQQPAAAQYSAQPDRQLSGSQGRPLYTQQSSALQSTFSGQGMPTRSSQALQAVVSSCVSSGLASAWPLKQGCVSVMLQNALCQPDDAVAAVSSSSSVDLDLGGCAHMQAYASGY